MNNSSQALGHGFIKGFDVKGGDLSPDPSDYFFQPWPLQSELHVCNIMHACLGDLSPAHPAIFKSNHCYFVINQQLGAKRHCATNSTWKLNCKRERIKLASIFSPSQKSTPCFLLLVISKRLELERWDCAQIVGLFK